MVIHTNGIWSFAYTNLFQGFSTIFQVNNCHKHGGLSNIILIYFRVIGIDQ